VKHQLDPTHPNGVALMGLSLQFLDVDDEYVEPAPYESDWNKDGHSALYDYTGRHTALFNDGGSAGKRFKVFPTKASGDIS
jgi:hypothetical protein